MNFLTQLFSKESKKKGLFSDIVGHEKIKSSFEKFLSKDKKVEILLTGDPSTAKTKFLDSMREHVKHAEFIPCNTASKAGVMEKLFSLHKDTEVLLLDEIDKMKPADQDVFLHLLESGTLQSTKVRKQKARHFSNLKVFATCNNIDRLTEALQSRFLRLHLKAYNHAEYIHVCKNMADQFDISEELAEYIGQKTWDMKCYVRDFVKIARHSETKEEADDLLEMMENYGEPKADLEDA
jgi:Holliday junction resolvasome RuvABC ATP-dependent DNA helicase subunit